ncbi:MAG: RIP metalloprotease RseP [Gemmatimonadetes bacterium]|uniref:Zinc metalloprotease n=1 Tax=Candidatus Kutchimonas denitrificans TaxID=3056748 RepID=A0AAE4ZBJ8_9BACT|nr:RIP metalloprotease RseP [Gemmatimonadota bacterium]NIR76237.1 RIP metalloprotease RseP [Candidatus Kutchimonas denitrificans]NIS00677.1 RIP metalloprotease RseP [Gemmatimonadota bacterium]NIT66822.1 RIP metalloprotease RseP [Gemmatimonadota bacterium]NIV23421.1 RIP metalloprotease RseP [Gemmatimonadota bacterium]
MQTVLAFVIVLGVLIFVHELGHFVTAKLAGIAVPRFSIGLGPKVWGFTIGETEYVISALPLGGYVKMAGMGEEEALEKLEGGKSELEVPPERRFDSKPIGTRAVVISAGVIMNFLFAVVAFAGLAYYNSPAPIIGEVSEDWPAAEAGIEPGDRILAVDGEEVTTWNEFVGAVQDRPGESAQLRIRRDGREIQLTTDIARFDTVVTNPATGADTALSLGRVGLTLDTDNPVRGLGLPEAMSLGVTRTGELSWLILEFLGDVVTGQASARDIGGPVLIGQMSGQAARAGAAAFIAFMAILSVHLAVLNLLPIPILDGGHLVFLGIEAVRGRALSLEARARMSQVGFILIMALMVWAFTADFLRIFGG